ncbi:hypothetical protein CEXT_175561 [Caerostris extrusa]|uniref:Uncharacterized protein n=1 Tax=Caerostris extrusa TaxID=172846 RepID=A0AAV4TY45_CAEEX|nr:hypothetical protein CEXT_175561 [Caerostris extrusa]
MLVFAFILKRRDSGYAGLRDQFPDEAQLGLFPLDMCQRVSANKSRMRRDKSGSVCDRQTSTVRSSYFPTICWPSSWTFLFIIIINHKDCCLLMYYPYET